MLETILSGPPEFIKNLVRQTRIRTGARAFTEKNLAALDRCFEMISEKLLTTVGFKSELA